MRRIATAVAVLALTCSLPAATQQVRQLTYRVVHTYPHDADSFTEGLELHNGVLYESSGQYGRSYLFEQNLKTGAVVKRIPVSPAVFGEGITLLNGVIFQLTWESQLGFIYNAATLAQTGTFHYTGEGWGLTNDGHTIYMSDGSPVIRCIDPKNFTVVRTIPVHDGATAIQMVNELEWVKGRLYANVWHTDRIAEIDPATGRVMAWIDLAGLRPKEATDPEAVLNGIAYDPATNHLLVTGKLWPKLFEIAVEPKR